MSDLWIPIVVSIASALVGGAIGGMVGSWKVAHSIGKWQQRVEDKLASHDERLDKTDERLDTGSARFEGMRVVEAVQMTIREELKDVKASCSARRSEIYQRLGQHDRDLTRLCTQCDETHRRKKQ